MFNKGEGRQFRHILIAIPHDKYYFMFVDEDDPKAGKQISLNMNRDEVHEVCS